MGGAIGRPLRVRDERRLAITGALLEIGPDWLLIQEGPGREVLLALTAVTICEGLAAATGPTVGGVKLRLNLRFALRGIARVRSPVAIVVCGGVGEPTGLYTEITGTVDRVGGDFVEVALHAPWEPRRAGSVPIDRLGSPEGCRPRPGTTAGVTRLPNRDERRPQGTGGGSPSMRGSERLRGHRADGNPAVKQTSAR